MREPPSLAIVPFQKISSIIIALLSREFKSIEINKRNIGLMKYSELRIELECRSSLSRISFQVSIVEVAESILESAHACNIIWMIFDNLHKTLGRLKKRYKVR